MFKEEGRKSLEFAKKRQMVLFPLLLTLVTAITTIGLQFLVGDSSAQVADIESKTFTWQELRFALHLPLLMFSLGMGTFAFMGHDAIVHRSGTKNFLLRRSRPPAPSELGCPLCLLHQGFAASMSCSSSNACSLLEWRLGILARITCTAISTPLDFGRACLGLGLQ